MRAAFVVCLVAGCGRFGFDAPRTADADPNAPPADTLVDAPGDAMGDAASDATVAIIGYATYVGTWSDTSSTVHHANVDVAWPVMPSSSILGSCAVATGGSCETSNVQFSVTTAMTQEVYGVTAYYEFANPAAVHTVVYTLDATAGTVPTIYPPGVGDRMQYLHGDGARTNIPGLTCTPPDLYYYTSANVTITCSW